MVNSALLKVLVGIFKNLGSNLSARVDFVLSELWYCLLWRELCTKYSKMNFRGKWC